MRVLITDDDRDIRELTAETLAHSGYFCDAVASGEEAVGLALKNSGQYDLCLMDIDMPGINGFEATARMRRLSRYFPIMAVTANSEVEKRFAQAGMDDFLRKPYRIEYLFIKMRSLTTKVIRIRNEGRTMKVEKETPMDAEQLKELRGLDKKGLAMLVIEGGQQKFVVHKNIQNKMAHILIGEEKELFEFIDRGENPANCHLYKCNMQTNRLLLTPEQFSERIKTEDSDIEKYTLPVDQKQRKNTED